MNKSYYFYRMNADIKEIVANKIENESEYSHLDFKKEQYPLEKNAPKKPEFLKDIMAFANFISKEDKYIIIGVEEVGGVADTFSAIESLNDQASYQQYVNEYIEPEINFEYAEIIYNDHKLAYFRLFDNDKFPYLFKKDLNHNGFRYDVGSGFVRVGTTTRKLKRDDFEKMYASRYVSVKDRKDDLSFRIFNAAFTDSCLRKSRYRHLRIDVINNSNKSIEFDVEVKLKKSEEYRIELTQNLEKRLFTVNRNAIGNAFLRSIFSVDLLPSKTFADTYVEYSNNIDYEIFQRAPESHKTYAVTLKQHSETKNIFNNQIAIFFENPVEVQLEIIARSDDFLDGPLVQKIILPKFEPKI